MVCSGPPPSAAASSAAYESLQVCTTARSATTLTLSASHLPPSCSRVQSWCRSRLFRFSYELHVRCTGIAGADHCQSARSHSVACAAQVRRLAAPIQRLLHLLEPRLAWKVIPADFLYIL